MDEGQQFGRNAWGAYGFRITGFEDPAAVLVGVPSTWPLLQVVREAPDDRTRPSELAPGRMRLDDVDAEVWLGDRSRIEIDRASMRIRLVMATPPNDEALAHPFLGLPAAVASHWLGRQILHGG